MRNNLAIRLGVVFSFLALALGAWSQAPKSNEDYVLGVGDVISIAVFGDPDLSRSEVRIIGEGYITMPLLPNERLKASGRTAESLGIAISDAYKKNHILKDPQVSVSIKEFHSSPVTVAGAVGKATTLQVQGRTSLMQAITAAEWFAKDVGTTITISRRGEKGPEGTVTQARSFNIPVKDFLQRPEDPTVNVELVGGDIVTVSRTEFVYIGGAVTKPGMLAVGDNPNWTILTVLAAVGNPTKIAKLDSCAIRRMKLDGTTEDIPVNAKKILDRKAADVQLMANDILLVPTSAGKAALYKAAETLSGAASGLLVVAAGR